MAHSNSNSVFKCEYDPNLTCLQQFLKNHSALTYVRIKPDGDCFFSSIAEYYKRTGGQIDGLANPTDVIALREFIMDRARKIIDSDEILHQLILTTEPKKISKSAQKKLLQKKKQSVQEMNEEEMNEEEMNEERLDNIFDELSERYVFEVPAFDVIVQITSRILNVNLSIYSVTGNIVSNTLYRAPNPPRNRDVPTIILYLATKHYGLLYPAAGPNIRSNAQKRENMQARNNKKNEYNATQAYIQRLMNKNERNALRASHRAKPSASRIVSRKAKLSFGNESNSESDPELQAALANSLAIANSLRGVSLKNGRKPVPVKKRPGVARNSVNALAASMGSVSLHNISRKANSNVLNARSLIKMTIPSIDDTVVKPSKRDPSIISLEQELRNFELNFPNKLKISYSAKKEVLYELFITAKLIEQTEIERQAKRNHGK
jgi:hypothetical protein